MRKLYFLFILSLIFANTQAQTIVFADPILKSKLLESAPTNEIALNLSGVPIVIDVNGDNEIQYSEAALVKVLTLDAAFTNIVGLEHFTNLENLGIANSQLGNITFPSLPNLKLLGFSNGTITQLHLSALTGLTHFDCESIPVTVLELPQSLENFRSRDIPIGALDLSDLTNLKEVNVTGSLQATNFLDSIDVSGCTNLLNLQAPLNALTNLNVSGCTNLTALNCQLNLLTTLDLSDCHFLYELLCAGNQLTSLTLNLAGYMDYMDCTGNPIQEIQINPIGAATVEIYAFLSGSSPQLQALDLSKVVFGVLNLSNSQLTSLNIKNGHNDADTSIDLSGNPGLAYICSDENEVDFLSGIISSYGYACNINSYCSFVPGGTIYAVAGTTTLDLDTNGCTVSDNAMPNLKFEITDGTTNGTAISDASGNYAIPIPEGTHLITPILEMPGYFNVSPSNFVADFPAQTSPNVQNFCITPNGSHHDLEVVLQPLAPARPGFNANYALTYKNKGTTTQSGTVCLSFEDPVLDLISTNPATASQAPNTLIWNFTNLLPFETRTISFTMKVNAPTETPPVVNGSVLNYVVSLNTAAIDEMPADNIFEFKQTVVGSFDPNDKTCLEGVTVSPATIGEYVHYVIRFENTGTFAAQNVVVKDSIDAAQFDVETLVPLQASHSFVTRITEGNKAEFIFENINLPFDDANNDGYITFKIKTNPTLVVGDTFSNSASIYFDYNFPITTDPAVTTITALGKADFEFSNFITLYPNPVQNLLNLYAKQIEVKSITIYNMLGQVVIAVANAQKTTAIDVSALDPGNYFVKVNSDKGAASARFIKN